MTTAYYPQKQQAPNFLNIFAQIIVALAGGVVLFSFIVMAGLLAYNVIFWGRIFPGVSVAGVDVSGMTRAEAEKELSQVVTYPITGKILLRDGEKMWLVAPAQMGMLFDPSATARSAMATGRSGGIFIAISNQISTLQGGVDVAPVMVLDGRTAYEFIQALAATVNRPVIEASLDIDGINVTSAPGQIGRLINVDKTLALVISQMQTFRDGEVPLVIEEKAPEIMDASAQADSLRKVLAAPLTISLPAPQVGDPGPWTLQPAELSPMLQVERVMAGDAKTFLVTVNPQMLQPFLSGIANQLDRQPENARFIFNDDTRKIDLTQPSVTGYSVRVEDTLASINAAIATGQSSVQLAVDTLAPQVTSDSTAESLGIVENIITYSTYFRGSSEARIQNIKTAAARFHGLLVAPGETFSMGNALGDVSLDNGYAEAMIIYGNKTIKGVGGGVCQVSTTLFRTVFNAGFPVVERYAHAYRVSYYEQDESSVNRNLSGLDATVYFPLVDFKFTNDTPYWLLMETYVNEGARRITWKIYSTSDGRSVDWTTTGPVDIVPAPEPAFVENTDLGPGDMRQVDWAADGADVVVNRTVYRDGGVYFQDEFRTHYLPWQAICEYNAVDDLAGTAEFRGICQP